MEATTIDGIKLDITKTGKSKLTIKFETTDGLLTADTFIWQPWSPRQNGIRVIADLPDGSTKPIILQVEKEAWETITQRRDGYEPLKKAEPAETGLRLIKVSCEGNLVSVDGYRLSSRVNSTEWNKIKHAMEYVDTRINDEIWHGSKYNGYIVKSGHEAEVERILDVKPENRIATRQATRQKATAQKAEQETLIKECKKAFESAKTPSPKGGLRVLTGETYGPGASSGGSGWWFVINKSANRIWYVQNNGADGDNWNSNNVRTGGAGAVGCWLPYQVELAAKIEQIATK